MSLKIVYIAGAGRSGSTLLDRMLGEVDGFFSVGELRQVWDHAILGEARCGCGVDWSDCPFWSAVFREDALREAASDAGSIIQCRDQYRAMEFFRRSRSDSGRERILQSMSPLVRVLEALYASIARESGARVVVDSSKFSSYGILLSLVDGFDVRVIHLVRDARAHAYSWGRKKAYLDPMPARRAAMAWIRSNLTAQTFLRPRVGGFLRLRHEDVVARPRQMLQDILDSVGEPDAAVPDLSGGRLRFGVNHTVGGNPDRFAGGETRLVVDERWKQDLSGIDRGIVSALTWPWLAQYGYLGKSG